MVFVGHQCPTNWQHKSDLYIEPFPEGKEIDDDLYSLNYKRNHSHLSTSGAMSGKSTPKLVYQRRRHRKGPLTISAVQPFGITKLNDGSHYAISCEDPSLAVQEFTVSVSARATEAVRSPVIAPVECGTVALASSNRSDTEVESGRKETLMTEVGRNSNACGATNNDLSSKSNLGHNSASLKIDTDNAGKCLCSGALTADKASEEISEREICTATFRSQGLLDEVQTGQDRVSTGNVDVHGGSYCSMSCNVCKHVESTSEMLICDHCEDAFHCSCCNPHVTILPVGEWLCNSCTKKKHKLLNEKSPGNSTSEGQFGSLEFMFRDKEPYMSSVRIGSGFQADVPEWCGPIHEASDLTGDPLEVDPSNVNNMEKRDAIKPPKLNFIGNWIKCQEVIDGTGGEADGSICGKWRRAPLFEAQIDKWECFRCVLWDPSQADCAVPQELETKEVKKQLKYIELLKPRMAVRRHKMNCSKSSRDLRAQRQNNKNHRDRPSKS